MAATPFPNQPPAFEGGNLFADDRALREIVAREAPGDAERDLEAWGERLGHADTFALADACNRFPPVLRTLDRTGERIDSVEFHPAWHELMRLATAIGEHASPWIDPARGAQVVRGARYVLHAQVENGTQCPLTMTYACVPALRVHGAAVPAIETEWLPKILARDYDPRALPVQAKTAALIGMGMTERQGGSDVRSNLTRAERQADGSYRLTGHKWFFSAPQSDAHLVLAQASAGLTCFFLPRFTPDGARNAIRLVRLKDKLGNRSNASAEVEFEGALAWPLGDEGRGVATIIDMVRHTRLDCALGTAGMMRGGLAWALHHAAHRIAFGRLLIEQPLMENVLADLALESEAALALAIRLARAFEAASDESERALARVMTPAAKYWICKRGPPFAAEAMEALGGNGYVEENPLPRLYREMPVNSIWEGSGNVIALDVLRALARNDARDALAAELARARGADRRFDAFCDALDRDLKSGVAESVARRIAQGIAVALQGALLIEHAPSAVADGFCASRLDRNHFNGAAFGTLPAGVDTRAIVARALPG